MPYVWCRMQRVRSATQSLKFSRKKWHWLRLNSGITVSLSYEMASVRSSMALSYSFRLW